MGSSWREYDIVFAGRNGGPLETATLHRWFKAICGRAGLTGFIPYSLRYSYATLQLLAGERDKVISDTMGHTKVNFNRDVYQKVLPVMQEQASDSLERLLFQTLAQGSHNQRAST